MYQFFLRKTLIDGGDKGIIIKINLKINHGNLSILGKNTNGSFMKNVKISGGSPEIYRIFFFLEW